MRSSGSHYSEVVGLGGERFSASILRPPRGLAVKGRTLSEPRPRNPERSSGPLGAVRSRAGPTALMRGRPTARAGNLV